jgi:hypothetical protein
VTPEAFDGGHRRAYAGALLLLAAGAVLLLAAYGMTWVHVQVTLVSGLAATKDQDQTGRELLPVAAAGGWVALAGLAGIVATRGWGRTAVAILVLLAGLAGLAGAVVFRRDLNALVADATVVHVSASWAWAAVGAVAVAVAGGWTVARGRTWPAMGTRYERTGSPRATRSTWDLQDMGQDPTDDLVE